MEIVKDEATGDEWIMVEDHEVLRCKDCKLEDPPMVILKDEVWDSIALEKDVLCFGCMQSRLLRPITFDDLKPCGMTDHLLLGVRIFLQTQINIYNKE